MWLFYVRGILLSLVMGLAACSMPARTSDVETNSQPPVTSHGSGDVTDFPGLVDSLRAQGLSVEPGKAVQQTLFPVESMLIMVDGGEIQVFEFSDEAAAKAASASVSAEGDQVGTSMVTWVDDPHFYRQDRLIVLYVGQDQAVLEALSSTLGPQVAGQ